MENNKENLKIYIFSNILEKKSKLRNYFEKKKNTIVVPFYEDTHQSLTAIAQKFFYGKKIKISNQNINFIVERVKGDRMNLKNELEKIYSLSLEKSNIEFEEILKLTNLAENYSFSELIDQCLAKNKKVSSNNFNWLDHSKRSIYVAAVDDIFSFRFDDFEIVNYKAHPHISGEIAI